MTNHSLIWAKDIEPGLLGYWRWAYPDLVSNATCGILVKYIVGMALRCVDGRARTELGCVRLLKLSPSKASFAELRDCIK